MAKKEAYSPIRQVLSKIRGQAWLILIIDLLRRLLNYIIFLLYPGIIL